MGCKKDINQQIEALLSQVQTVINETAVPVDERIQRVADIYRQAEKLANENDLEDQMKESLLVNSARFFAEYGKYIGNSGRKSRQSTIISCGLESITPKRGSGRTAEKPIGA